MYCKYCAASLGENGALKCPNCGADINLLDGGQTFYEEADLQLWREKEPAEDSTPKTVIRPINNFAQPQEAPSKQTAETVYRGGFESVVKLAIVCVTALVALALILAVVIISMNSGSGKKTNKIQQTINKSESKYVSEHKLADLCDSYDSEKSGDYTSEDKTPSDNPSQSQLEEDVENEISLNIYVPKDVAEKGLVFSKNDKNLYAFKKTDNFESVYYVSIDDFASECKTVTDYELKDGLRWEKDDNLYTYTYTLRNKSNANDA